MADFFLKIQSRDAKALGFVVEKVTGLYDSAAITPVTQAIYGRRGVARVDTTLSIGDKDVVASGWMRAADPADLDTKVDRLKAWCNRGDDDGYTWLVFGNQPERQLRCLYRGVIDGPVPPQFVQVDAPISVHFEAIDGYFVDVTPQSVEASAGVPVALPLGTIESLAVITITLSGSASSVRVTYRKHDGTEVAFIECTPEDGFEAGDVLVIDNDNQTLTLNGDPADAILSDGDFLAFHHRDGSYDDEEWPTIETNHGALGAAYSRNWE